MKELCDVEDIYLIEATKPLRFFNYLQKARIILDLIFAFF